MWNLEPITGLSERTQCHVGQLLYKGQAHSKCKGEGESIVH